MGKTYQISKNEYICEKEMRERVKTTALTLKKISFDQMGDPADVIKHYAAGLADGFGGKESVMPRAEAERMIAEEFKKLYNKTPEQYVADRDTSQSERNGNNAATSPKIRSSRRRRRRDNNRDLGR